MPRPQVAFGVSIAPERAEATLGGGARWIDMLDAAQDHGLAPLLGSTPHLGALLYPVRAAGDVFTFRREWIRDIDTAMTSSVVVIAFPDAEIVPPPLRGQTFTLVRGCSCGDLAVGQALIDRIRTWRTPLRDMFGPLPFRGMAAISQDLVDPVPATCPVAGSRTLTVQPRRPWSISCTRAACSPSSGIRGVRCGRPTRPCASRLARRSLP